MQAKLIIQQLFYNLHAGLNVEMADLIERLILEPPIFPSAAVSTFFVATRFSTKLRVIVKSRRCPHYRIVYRKALLEPPIAEQFEIGNWTERYDVWFGQLGTDGDHIHILCSFHLNTVVGGIVGMFKSITTKQPFKQFPELRKELMGR